MKYLMENLAQNNKEELEVRDLKEKGRYVTDILFIDHYAKLLGVFTVGVYNAICRHSNVEQICWPSISKISEELDIGRNSVINAIKRLEFWQIIKRYRIGKRANNRYKLISRKCWLPINEDNIKKYSEVCQINFNSFSDKLQWFARQTSNSKETKSKEIKERSDSFKNNLTISNAYKQGDRSYTPFYQNEPMRWVVGKQKWYVISKYNEWLSFADKESKIEWR